VICPFRWRCASSRRLASPWGRRGSSRSCPLSLTLSLHPNAPHKALQEDYTLGALWGSQGRGAVSHELVATSILQSTAAISCHPPPHHAEDAPPCRMAGVTLQRHSGHPTRGCMPRMPAPACRFRAKSSHFIFVYGLLPGIQDQHRAWTVLYVPSFEAAFSPTPPYRSSRLSQRSTGTARYAHLHRP